MLTREQIVETERTVNRYTQLVNEAADKRDSSREALESWRAVCDEWHQAEFPTDHLWSNETQQGIKEGDRAAIDDALLFLDVDPWFFRSGYLKEWLLEDLRQAPLTEDDKARLRQIILKVAGGKNRREFKRYCSLAVKVTTDEFELELEKQAKEHDADSSGKFSYLLRYIREHRHDY